MLFKKFTMICYLLLASGLFSLLALLSALVGQYVFLLHPCPLCIYQRIPYIVIILISIFALFPLKSPRVLYIAALFCTMLFLVDAGIAAYHTGIEVGFFSAPDTCSGGGDSGDSLEAMRAAIRNAPLVSCAQAMAYIFGLSMAAWNMLAAFLAFAISATFLAKIYKRSATI